MQNFLWERAYAWMNGRKIIRCDVLKVLLVENIMKDIQPSMSGTFLLWQPV
jgi:hypothetical protein